MDTYFHTGHNSNMTCIFKPSPICFGLLFYPVAAAGVTTSKITNFANFNLRSQLRKKEMLPVFLKYLHRHSFDINVKTVQNICSIISCIYSTKRSRYNNDNLTTAKFTSEHLLSISLLNCETHHVNYKMEDWKTLFQDIIIIIYYYYI